MKIKGVIVPFALCLPALAAYNRRTHNNTIGIPLLIDLSPIFPAVRQAVDLTRRVRQLAIQHSSKAVNDPVTIGDYGSQALILRAFAQWQPDAAVLAEEHSEQFLELVSPEARGIVVKLVSDILGESVTEGDIVRWLDFGSDRVSARRWTLDPIDGTRGFVNGRRYSVALGLVDGADAVAGLLACPGYPSRDGQGVLMYTTPDGAYGESLAGGGAWRLRAREVENPALLRPVESIDHVDYDQPVLSAMYDLLGIPPQQVEPLDGQDKYAVVAAGDGDFYVRPSRPQDRLHYIWDHAAGAAIVGAAGGVVSALDGTPLDFSHGERLPKAGVIVSSAKMYERVLAAVQQVVPVHSI
jgi:3'(2'), 5'-bisphosphate nucleotidase